MIHLHVEGKTIAEVYKELEGILQFHGVGLTEPAPTEPKKEPKAPKKEAAAPETTNHVPPVEITFKRVSELISAAMPVVGKPKLVEILASFGAKKAGELKPEQYAKFVADTEAAMHGAASLVQGGS